VESLGNKLKTAREEQGLSYDRISNETNISTRYMQALEREDFSIFPGETYILGFLKTYGEYLGLNAKELKSLYNSIKIQEQPVPMEQLLRDPSPLPKIFKVAGISLLILAILGGIIYFILNFPRASGVFPSTARTASEYTFNADFMERRFYPGDSILVTQGTNTHRLLFASLGDAITITTPRGPVVLDLGQEVAIDLNNDGFPGLRIIAADFVKNDSASGALLRFEQQQLRTDAGLGAPLQTMAREAAPLILSSANPFPFTLQVSFQTYCLFRYEILFERDRPGRNEQFYQRAQELSIQAQNGIRLGISNAQAVRLQVIGGGRTVPLEVGGPGEVVAADLRWIRDDENRFRLVLLRLE
jgi:transcriptional regulator with XRE-family HTH domain